jgi:amino acid adenylation domain-containing protein/non-ribosomal peptide synthase protein (TIGR01720 family)
MELAGFRLSQQQRRLWQLGRAFPGSVFHAACTIEIGGPLDQGRLVAAIAELCRRHEILRTTFRTPPGASWPLQVVGEADPSWPGGVAVADLTRIAAARGGAAIAAVRAALMRDPFDLERGPLLRVCLVRLEGERHRLLLALPALVADARTLALLCAELGRAYATPGTRETDQELEPLQYVDYAEWQREVLAGDGAEAATAFWRRRAGGPWSEAPAVAAAARGPEAAAEVRTREVAIAGADLERLAGHDLERLAGRLESTVPDVLLAAWLALLWRLAGETPVTVAVGADGRPFADLENACGPLAVHLPLRVEIERGLPFRELVARVAAARRDGLAAQEYFSRELVRRPERSEPSALPYGFEIGEPEAEAAGGAFRLVDCTTWTEPFHLRLACRPGAGGWRVSLACSTSFATATLAAVASTLAALVEAAVAEPDLPLGALQLGAAGPHAGEAGAAREAPLAAGAATFDDLFAAQVARTPEAPAVAYEGRQLSYGELDRRVVRLAAHLRRLGVGPESRVGICLDRSLEMIVALLAVFRAGGAYVPLDPRFPRERLTFQVEDAGIEVLLASGDLARDLPERVHRVDLAALADDLDAGATTPEPTAAQAESGSVSVQEHRGRSRTEPERARPGLQARESPQGVLSGSARRAIRCPPKPSHGLRAVPENAAYVVYTSGSTGQPKGVVVEHRQLLNYVQGIGERLALPPRATAATLSTLGADLGNTVIFPLLASGGCVHVIAHDRITSAPALAAYFDEHAIDVVKIVPSHLAALLAQQASASLLPRRLLVLGGESARGDLLARLRALAPGCAILNHYGPTETTVGVTTHLAASGALSADHTLPIGRALPRCTAHVVDAELRPLPTGVPGELVIGGDSVARGYLGRPAATAASFLPDPFASVPGSRLYRTGDRAVRGFDGELRFLGRVDHQVKLRGFRIELGEIEAALRRHPQVGAAVVTLREDYAGEPRLVAYLVPAGDPTVAELRAHLEASLPDYMVPAAFVPLPALPLNANGKIDRAALPAPETARRLRSAAPVAPRDDRERALAAIWREVLRVEQVGLEDNFFALGGDSILCIQVVSRARRAGLVLTPRQIFEHPTIAQLAPVAGTMAATGAPPAGSPAAADDEGDFPLAPIQRWFFERELAAADHWNNSLLLELEPGLQVAALRRAAAAVVARHEALRLRFFRTAVGWRQRVAAAGEPLPFQIVDLSGLAPEGRAEAILHLGPATQASLSIERGPLFRFVVWDLGPRDGRRLHIVVHHLAVDGVSWRVLLEDLDLACGQAGSGGAIDLGPATASYRDWCLGLERQAGTPELVSQAAHWVAAGCAPGELPRDLDAGPDTVATADTVTVRLAGGPTRSLLREAPRAYRAEPQDLLVTALLRAVARWTGEPTLVLGLESHGREAIASELDLSRTAGWFTARYPLRLVAPAASGPGAALKAVKQRLREIPGRGAGYGLLRYLGPEEVHRSLSGQTPPPLGFNYLGQVDALLEEHGRFRPAPESTGLDRSPRGQRSHPLEVNCLVRDGELQASWIYSRGRHRRATVEALAGAFVDELEALVAHCLEPGIGGYAPADFPLARLDPATLDRVTAGREPGSAREIEDLLPLAPIQEGMLFHTLYAAGSELYVEQLSCVLAGLDRDAFAAAWAVVAQRHPMLRTGVCWEGLERPLQAVQRRIEIPIERHDWREAAAGEEERRLAELLAADRRRGLDLAAPPLMRLHWIELPGGLPEGRGRFVWTHHHLLTDGWSTAVLLGDLFTAYAALRRGEPPALPPARPYRDYVAFLESRDRRREELFWRGYLAGLEAATMLPAGRPAGRPAAPAAVGGALHGEASLHLGAAETAAVVAFARRHALTLNTVLQGAWAVLLARASGVSDVVFGVTLSGRPAELDGVERIVGPFLNTLPLRVRVEEDLPPADWLRRLQASQLAVLEHQASALADVQAWSPLGRGQSLFESILVFENYPVAEALRDGADAGPELAVDDVRAHVQLNYPLALVTLPGERLFLYATFDRRRLAPVEVRRLLGCLEALLVGLAGEGCGRLEDLPLQTSAARHQLLVEWNDTPPPPGEILPLPQLLAERAARQPSAPAVVHGEELATYRELDLAVDALARRLGGLGVGPEVAVAVALERSLDWVVATLAVLRAGGVYLPLDPALPRDRLAYVLGDSGAALLVTNSRLRERFAAAGRPRVLCLDLEPAPVTDSFAGAAPRAPIDPLDPEQAAYVIYTSGSTGAPKGVVLHHRGLANLAAAQADGFGVRAGDRVLQFASPSFDASVSEIAMAIHAGATLVLADPAILADPEALARLLTEQRVDVATLPPTMLRLLAAEGPRPRVVISAGETCTADVVARWGRDHQLIDAYGPSEATVCASLGRCTVDQQAGEVSSEPGIGRPLAGTRIHLLDDRLRPLPPGAAGELCIGGAGVGRGYLGLPRLTAERFVPDPFAEVPGSRLYRSGDLARHRHDGALEHLGRRDRQLKIRGYRVEPGEVESALRHHPGVRDAAVVARPLAAGAASGEAGAAGRLVAYVVPRAAPAPRLELWPSVAEYFVYDDALYHAMTHDELRNRRYREALAELVPGRTVLDVGTGPEALLARLCVAAGARRVYAVELLEDTFLQAQRRVRELGLEDRIVLVRGDATTIDLPEPADVCVSEIVGAIGGAEGAAAILGAVRRLMAPGGRMVPERALTRIAAVTLPGELVASPAFGAAAAGYVRRIFDEVGRPFDLRLCLKGVTPADLVSDAAVFEDLDFRGPVPLAARHAIELRFQRRARVDGFLVWLQLFTAGDHQLDILADRHCWLPVWLPAFDPGIEVAPGGSIRATVTRTLSADGLHPDFRIEGELDAGDGAAAPFVWTVPHVAAGHRQSPFYARLFATDHIPVEPPAAEPTAAALRAHLERTLPDFMLPAAFVSLPELPLTASGKVDARRLPDPDGERPALAAAFVAPRDAAEERLAAIFRQVLGVAEVGVHDDFFALGGDSILSIQVVGRARRDGLRLTPQQLFQHPTVAGLAAVAGAVGDAGGNARSEADGAETASGDFPLTPIQHWFFAQRLHRREHWNQSLLLEVRAELSAAVIAAAWSAIVGRHAALRLRFTEGPEGWRQAYSPRAEAAAALGFVDLSTLEPAARRRALEHGCELAQASLALDGGLARAVLFRQGAGGERLLLAVHHLVVDGVSWRILLEDLETACRQLVKEEAPQLGPASASYRRWAEGLTAHAAAGGCAEELPYWRGLAGAAASLPVDPLDPRRGGANLWRSREAVRMTVDSRATAELLRGAARHRVEVPELLLAALARTLGRWSGATDLLVDLEGHGREDELAPGIDLARTVGWFTALYPVRLGAGSSEPSATLAEVRARLRAVPRRGVGFGLLRHLSPDPEVRRELEALPRAEVSFNYLGRFDSLLADDALFGLAPEPAGAPADARSEHPHALTVSARVALGELHLEWGFSGDLHRRETIEGLAERCLAELATLAAIAAIAEAGAEAAGERFLPARFPWAALAPDELDELPPGIEDLYPLTGMQEVMVEAAARFPAAAGVYHCQQCYTLRDPTLSLPALVAALRGVVRANPALRTVLLASRGRRLQAVLRDVEVGIEVHDVAAATAEMQDEAIESWLHADRRRPFAADGRDPLLRAALFPRGRDRVELCLAMHHAVTDGWGQVALLGQLHDLYRAAKRGEALPAAVRPNALRDLVGRERTVRLSTESAAFWERHLHGRAEVRLRTSSRAEASFARHDAAPAPELAAVVRRRQRELRVTAKAVLLAAFLDAWGERHGGAVPTVGVVTHVRDAVQADPLGALGLFWTLVPFTCPRDGSRDELVRRVHASLGEIAPHALFPLPQLAAGDGELFAATFNFVQVHAGSRLPEADGMELLAVRGHDRLHYPLNLIVTLADGADGGDGADAGREGAGAALRVAADYDRRYFTAAEVETLIETYQEILAAWPEESLPAPQPEPQAQGAIHADR